MRFEKPIPVNMTFHVLQEQLRWTKHAKDRLEERKVKLPKPLSRWEMIEKRYNQHGNHTLTLRYRRKGQMGCVIVVQKVNTGMYDVITAYPDDRKTA